MKTCEQCGEDYEMGGYDYRDAETGAEWNFCDDCMTHLLAPVVTQHNEPDLGPDESMDGDHESALASAGLGTDEDYRPDAYLEMEYEDRVSGGGSDMDY